MARITRLSDVSAVKRKPFDVKSALRECLCIPACIVLVLASPLAILGFGIMYLASRAVFRLTGKYSLNLTLHPGAFAK